MSRVCELTGVRCDDDHCEEFCMEEDHQALHVAWGRALLDAAPLLAKRFLAIRTHLAPSFGQVVRIPEWAELPEGLRPLTIAAMRDALEEWLRDEGEERIENGV